MAILLKSTKSVRKLQQTPVEQPKIGQLYHLSWAKKRGMVWKLKAIDGEMCLMVTPKSNKEIQTHVSTLLPTNKEIVKNIRKK